MSKILVCYFSASGNTKKVAEKISKVLNADLFEIEPEVRYTVEDLDWTNKDSRSTKEMENRLFRPKVKNKVEQINNYDKVLIGFPVWWYTAPTIVNTFIEENDLTNKKIYIFVTSGSSSYEKCLDDLRESYSNINFISGKRFTENILDEEIIEWLNE